jgi:hypothetical protein
MASALQPPFSCLLLFFVANITPNSNAQTGLLQRFCGVCPQSFFQPPFSCLLLFFVANITPNNNTQTGLLQRFCGV